MPSFSYEELVKRIQEELRKIAPGALSVLDVFASKRCGRRYSELLAELRLPALKVLLASLYGSKASLETAICLFIARPLVNALGIGVNPRELTRLIMEEKWQHVYQLLGLGPAKVERLDIQEYKQILVCTYAIELLATKAYKLLAQAADDSLVAGIALYISEESRQHASAVSMLAEELGLSIPSSLEASVRECSDEHVKEYASLVNSIEEESNSVKGNPYRVSEYFKKLAGLEKIAGEERYARAMTPLIALLFGNEKRRSLVKGLIELIVSDEEHHEKLAKMISEYLLSST